MNFTALFQRLQDTAIGTAIRENDVYFPWIESVHVLAIVLVVGTIFIVDLRLLGLASTNRPVQRLMRDVLPITWTCFAVAAVTGSLLFSARAVDYTQNFFFLGKMVLLLLAAFNMIVFHVVGTRNIAQWDALETTPFAAKFAGGVSLTIWVAVVAFGRWIGFTLP
ncbi:MAG TPA: DUF6644 family protein [Pseudolabrys sp.]|nr:DUF6644 family protein [Pseudolabrys sp.]